MPVTVAPLAMVTLPAPVKESRRPLVWLLTLMGAEIVRVPASEPIAASKPRVMVPVVIVLLPDTFCS